MPQVNAVGELAQANEHGGGQHFIDQARRLLHRQQQHDGRAFHHGDAPDHGVLVIPLQLHDERHGQHQPHGVAAQRLQALNPLGLFHQQGGQQCTGNQARGAGVEAEKDFIELLALQHPEKAPQRAQHPQHQQRCPDAAGHGFAQH